MFEDVRLLGHLQVVDRPGQSIEIPGELPKALLAVLAVEVIQTARIEPRTPEGEVYVTHPFAALAGDLSIACQHVGTLPTAKGYGSLPLYALHQKL